MTQSNDGREHMRRALIMCAETFRFYAKQHRAKGTPDGNEKAVRNDDMAAMCERAFSGVASPVEGTGAWRDIASAPKDGLAERLQARIIEALDRWHDGSRERKATDIVAAIQPLIADALLSAEAERDELRAKFANLSLSYELTKQRELDMSIAGADYKDRALTAEARLAAMGGEDNGSALAESAGEGLRPVASDSACQSEGAVAALATALHNAVHLIALELGPDRDAARDGMLTLAKFDPAAPKDGTAGPVDPLRAEPISSPLNSAGGEP